MSVILKTTIRKRLRVSHNTITTMLQFKNNVKALLLHTLN